MSRQPNRSLIGGFVLGAIVLAVTAVLFFGSGRFLAKRYPFVMYFDGSVQGLSEGAPVVFKGVKIGTVTGIELRLEGREMNIRIPVFVEFEPEKISSPHGIRDFSKKLMETDVHQRISILVDRGLRAQLGLQSVVTGQLLINLDFHPDKPARLIGIDTEYPELPTIPSSFEEISSTIQQLPIQELVSKLILAIEGIERAVNSPELTEGMDSLNLSLKEMGKLVRHIDKRIDPLTDGIELTLNDTRNLVRHLDDQITPLASGIGNTLSDTRNLILHLDGEIEPLASGLRLTFKEARASLIQARETLLLFQGVIAEDSPMGYQITRSLKDLSSAARSIQALTDYLEEHPEALLRGKSSPGGP